MAGDAVEPRVELKSAKVIAIIDVAGVGGGEAAALGHHLDGHPVEIVVGEGEAQPVAAG